MPDVINSDDRSKSLPRRSSSLTPYPKRRRNYDSLPKWNLGENHLKVIRMNWDQTDRSVTEVEISPGADFNRGGGQHSTTASTATTSTSRSLGLPTPSTATLLRRPDLFKQQEEMMELHHQNHTLQQVGPHQRLIPVPGVNDHRSMSVASSLGTLGRSNPVGGENVGHLDSTDSDSIRTRQQRYVLS